MKWWKLAIVVLVVISAVVFATVKMYGGSEEEHSIAGTITGTVNNVNQEAWSFSINGTTVYLRGRYACGSTEFYAEDMLQKIAGERVTVKYSMNGSYPIAEEIILKDNVCTRIPGRGGH
ncbi:MAG: hypothetical protein GXN93_01950 [Candidatus Diapherotrites archaeon]|nr:hypothetical protein [Candidatus Diapherotrites archaeon]